MYYDPQKNPITFVNRKHTRASSRVHRSEGTDRFDDRLAGGVRPDGGALGLQGAAVIAPSARHRVPRRHTVGAAVVHAARLDGNLGYLQRTHGFRYSDVAGACEVRSL